MSMYENLDPAAAMAAVRDALSKAVPMSADLQKAWTQSGTATTGLTMYSLEAPAKLLYPVITPLRNRIPRAGGGQGIQANWKAITAINTASISIGVSEGNRGGVQSTTVVDYNAAFKSMGIEDYVTFEADLAAQGFDDAKARAVQGNLRSLMIGEEKVILGGQSTFGLGTTPTPSLATSAVLGGSIPISTTVYVRCVALTHEGYSYAAASAAVRAQVSRTNADSSTDNYGGGSAQASAAASQATAGTGGSVHAITATVAPVRGACGYAWFYGTTDGTAPNLRLHSVTTINSALILAVPAGTEAVLPTDLVSNDRSANNLVHDGYIAMVAKSGSGALWKTLPTGTAGTGTTLTADGAGGVVEVDDVLAWFWDNLKMSPTEMHVGTAVMNALRKRSLDGKSTGAQRFVFNQTQGAIVGGGAIRGYINQYAMDGSSEIPIKLHPNMPPGMIVFVSHEIPYSLSGVSDVTRILTRRDYYQIEWPMRSRKYEFGVYTDQVMQCYFLPAQAVMANIAAG